MKQTSTRRIEEELTRGPLPEPPAGLLERIREEIPEELGPLNSSSRGVPRKGWWLAAAASVCVAFAGGWLAYRVRLENLGLEAAVPVAPVSPPAPLVAAPDQARRVELPPAPTPAVREPPPVDSVSPPTESPQGAERAQATGSARSLDLPTTPAPGGSSVSVLESVAALPQAGPPEPARVEPPKEGLAPANPGAKGGVPGGVLGGVPGGVPGSEARRDVYIRVPAPGEISALQAAPRARRFVEPPSVPAPPSTGGTAEPNDQPYGDMFFGSYGVNPFIDTEDDALSTFGLDVDTGSYTLVRSYLERGHLPPPEAVRVEEFVNAFDYGDRPPRRGDFALTLAGAPTPYTDSDRYVLLRFGLVAREVPRRERPPAVLIFTVDVSGSMAQGNRLELVKDSLALLLDELEPDDEVGLVVYGSRGQVLLEPTRDTRTLERAISRLVPEGSTNAEEGLVLAYDLLSRHLRRGALHRVILCSDGVANVGRTGPESILERIERETARGIELTTVGFGMGNYNDRLMEQLADRGDGRYAYVDTLEEARRIFVEELSGTLQTVARDAKVQVEFDPRTVERYRLLGYENRDVADRDFRNDRVDAGEIGAGHGVTALYEVKLAEEPAAGEGIATLRLRYRSAVTDQVVESAETLSVADLARTWDTAPDSLRLAATVAELAELLKGSYWAKGGDLGLVLREAHLLERETGSEEAAELVSLTEAALALRDDSARPDPLERE